MIPIVIGALGMIPKYLEVRLKEPGVRRLIEPIQTTELLRLARIIMETWRDLDSCERLSANAYMKISQ